MYEWNEEGRGEVVATAYVSRDQSIRLSRGVTLDLGSFGTEMTRQASVSSSCQLAQSPKSPLECAVMSPLSSSTVAMSGESERHVIWQGLLTPPILQLACACAMCAGMSLSCFTRRSILGMPEDGLLPLSVGGIGAGDSVFKTSLLGRRSLSNFAEIPDAIPVKEGLGRKLYPYTRREVTSTITTVHQTRNALFMCLRKGRKLGGFCL